MNKRSASSRPRRAAVCTGMRPPSSRRRAFAPYSCEKTWKRNFRVISCHLSFIYHVIQCEETATSWLSAPAAPRYSPLPRYAQLDGGASASSCLAYPHLRLPTADPLQCWRSSLRRPCGARFAVHGSLDPQAIYHILSLKLAKRRLLSRASTSAPLWWTNI